MRRFILGAVALVALIAGCTAASHLKQLQPPAVPSSPPISASTGTIPAAGVFQRGVDIDAYTYPGQDIAAAATADVAYIKSLHANAVSISFPFFMAGPGSSTVYGTPATPTPAQLAVLAATAEGAGLRVTIRPLLDEKNLGYSRVHWHPVDPAAWFRSYTRFLLPYAKAAQMEHVQEFIVGAEFSMFGTDPHWARLDAAVRGDFHGVLGCSDNWGGVARKGPLSDPYAGNCGPGVAEHVDSYQPQFGPSVQGSWDFFAHVLPRGTVLAEVGIDAVGGAYARPYQHEWATATALDPQVQARWFAAACHAAVKEHLGGIYFWPVGLGITPGAGPTLTFQGAWGGAGARAISRCFAQIERSGK